MYGRDENKMGMRGTINAELFFEDLIVPEANRIGEEGEGVGNMMAALDSGRVFTASQAVGLAQGAIDEAINDRAKTIGLNFQKVEFIDSGCIGQLVLLDAH